MRLVVLEVADDKYADWFVRDIEEQVGDGVLEGVKLVGVFQAPTKYCDPSDGHRGKKTDAGWTRGKKYGWWVCAACKKPSKAWAKNLNAVLSSARNLLNNGKDTLGAAQRASEATTSSDTGQ
jgi:hypothetical protein